MALRNIRVDSEDILRKKSKEVKDINDRMITLLDDMAETMYSANGVGLAAPQVGILRRIVVIDIGEENDSGLIELINPVLLESSGTQTGDEACLSVPGKIGVVTRPDYCRVEALNREGEKVVIEGEGLLARAICHELDHLDGVLYTDKVEGELREAEQNEED